MYIEQTIQRPFGINVFGSAIVRVEPDIASLRFAVSRIEQHPKDAFQSAREAAQNVRAYLMQANIPDVSSSRVTLAESYRHTGGEERFVGYSAKVAFHVLLRDLDRMEEVLSGVIEAGTNELRSIELQTSRLKEIRAEARTRAVAVAREKAEMYCQATGRSLGPVIHIEDGNPDAVEGRRFHGTREPDQPDDEGPLRAFDPGSITVGGAVMVAFELGRT